MPASLLAVDLLKMRIGKGAAPAGWTGLHTDLRTDTLYAASGTTVLPQFAAANQTATWRSGRYVLDSQQSMAVLMLEGPFSSAVARLYGDGTLYHTTPSITSNRPVRLPARRFRELELEIEAAGRVTRAVLAASLEEALAA